MYLAHKQTASKQHAIHLNDNGKDLVVNLSRKQPQQNEILCLILLQLRQHTPFSYTHKLNVQFTILWRSSYFHSCSKVL